MLRIVPYQSSHTIDRVLVKTFRCGAGERSRDHVNEIFRGLWIEVREFNIHFSLATTYLESCCNDLNALKP